MDQEQQVGSQDSSPQRMRVPIVWWTFVGAWLGLLALDSAVTSGGHGPPGSWMHLGIALILSGPYLTSLFFDENGREFSSMGMWAAARRHWSGVVGILLMLAGVALMVATMILKSETIRPSEWALAIIFLLMPLISMFGITGPRVSLRHGALVVIGVIAAILIGGSLIYGARFQWAYAQLNLLMMGAFALLALLAFGVLRFMDWMIARSEQLTD